MVRYRLQNILSVMEGALTSWDRYVFLCLCSSVGEELASPSFSPQTLDGNLSERAAYGPNVRSFRVYCVQVMEGGVEFYQLWRAVDSGRFIIVELTFLGTRLPAA